MNLQEYLDKPQDKHEAARIADGMRFFVEIKKTAAAIPDVNAAFKTGGTAALNTPIAAPKSITKATKQWVAGNAKRATTRAPAIKKKLGSAEMNKEALLHYIPELLGGAKNVLGGAKNIIDRDLGTIKEQALGYKEGLAGENTLDAFGKQVNPGVLGTVGNWFQRHNPTGPHGYLRHRPELIDPTIGPTWGQRLSARFHPNTAELHPVNGVESPRVLTPRERLRADIIAKMHEGPLGEEELRRLKNRYAGFERGNEANKGYGTSKLYDHLYNSFTDANGDIGILSTLEGLHRTGMLKNEATQAAIAAGYRKVTGQTSEAMDAARRKRLAIMAGVGGGGALAGGLAINGLSRRQNAQGE